MSARVVRASVLKDSLISLVEEIRDNYPGVPADSPTPLCVSISQASIRMIYIELNLATEDTEVTEEEKVPVKKYILSAQQGEGDKKGEGQK